MHIKYTDSHCIYSSISFDADNNIFRISGEQSYSLEYNPILKLDQEYDPNNFFIILSNDSPLCTENSIYQVYIKKQRIGWIFPIQALLSGEHDYSSNKYFLKYAFVASYLLLENIKDDDNRETPSQFLLEDYYDARKCILVIDKKNTEKLDSFSIDNYIVSLYQYGYTFNGSGNIFAELPTAIERQRLTLKAVSTELTMNPNINFLFKEQLPIAENEVIRFYLCYQIIELLIAIVFEDQFQKLLKKLNADTEQLFDQRDLLAKIAGEKYRVKLLFNNYVVCDTSNCTDLNMACLKLLRLNNKDTSENYYENLYSVRCLLVHRLYSLSYESYRILQDINKPFLNLVIEILFSFKKPT